MDRKKERFLWISLSGMLAVVLAAVLLSPIAMAQSRKNTQEYIRELEAAMYLLQNNYVDEVDSEQLFRGAMDGMFASLDDPYSLYLNDELLEQMTDTTQGEYGGVGLYISKDRYDPDNPYGRLPYVKVVSPIEDTPGWKAGINAGDYIYAIEGESAEGFATQDVSDRLRGVPGTSVKVTILRGEYTFDLVLTRQKIEIPTVKTTIINGDIGYIRIIEFTPFTVPRVEEALTEFTAQGLDKLIVDVRSNPGGLLDSVVEIADFFFSRGVVVSTRYRQERMNQVHRATPGTIVSSDTKIAVLIDKGSASASEILTGALKDRGRATVIGETSFGKGSIQQMIPLDGTAIKLTTGRYYTPNGINIDKTGIEPDIAVKEPDLTDEQTKAYAVLLQENRIGSFVDSYPDPSPSQVNDFVEQLRSDGLDPGERIVRLLVKRESERRLNVPPVVDLEFDRVLLRGVSFLETGK